MNFIEWLINANHQENSVIYDIALDVRTDIKDGWKGSTYTGLVKRIKKLNGSDLALCAATTAYEKYKEKTNV